MISNFEREIFSQPSVIREIASVKEFKVDGDGVAQVTFVASGSSKNVADFGAYFFEQFTHLPVKVEYASELLGKEISFSERDLVVFISQSGESADVLEVSSNIKSMPCKKIALVNNIDSSIARNSDLIIDMQAGEELAVPATKSFSASFAVLYLLANIFAQNIVEPDEILGFADRVDELLHSDKAKLIAQKLKDTDTMIIVGHNMARFAANEISLKLQETAFINAFSYPLGEFIHGHMAILKNIKKVVAVSFLGDKNHLVNLENIKKFQKSYDSDVILITDDTSNDFEKEIVNISYSSQSLLPLLAIILFQQVCLELTKINGIDPDSPEGLNKIVQ